MTLVAGNRIAQAQNALRKKMEPGAFHYGGTAFDCTSKNEDPIISGGLLPEGVGNAASVDLRRITLNPDCGLTRADEGKGATYQGNAYTILKVHAPETAMGTAIALPVIVYRSPQAAIATAEGPTEANPGQRVAYRPKSAT